MAEAVRVYLDRDKAIVTTPGSLYRDEGFEGYEKVHYLQDHEGRRKPEGDAEERLDLAEQLSEEFGLPIEYSDRSRAI